MKTRCFEWYFLFPVDIRNIGFKFDLPINIRYSSPSPLITEISLILGNLSFNFFKEICHLIHESRQSELVLQNSRVLLYMDIESIPWMLLPQLINAYGNCMHGQFCGRSFKKEKLHVWISLHQISTPTLELLIGKKKDCHAWTIVTNAKLTRFTWELRSTRDYKHICKLLNSSLVCSIFWE